MWKKIQRSRRHSRRTKEKVDKQCQNLILLYNGTLSDGAENQGLLQQPEAQPYNAAAVKQYVQYPATHVQQPGPQPYYSAAVEQYVQYPAMHVRQAVPQPYYSAAVEQYVQYPATHLQQPVAQSNYAAAVEQYVQQPVAHSNYTKTAEQYVQIPATHKQQLAAQSSFKATGKKNVNCSGMNVQPSTSRPNHKPILQSSVQSQDSSASVTNTSGGAESVATTKGVIEVDSTNAARLLIAQPDVLSGNTPNLWHKVTVKTGIVDRERVIGAINKRISPLMLIPYFFRLEDGHITFLVNNCNAPLTTLFRRNLKVPFLDTEIELKVQLHAEKVDLPAKLQNIIHKSLSSEKTFLDLSNLVSIPEVQEVIYHSSDTTHLQQQLLKTAQVIAPELVSLSLAGNELSTVTHLTDVFADRTKWKSLKILDVTDNKIGSISELVAFHTVSITELYLHKNPVCGKYKEAHTYISVIKVNFPHLIKLDGTYLQCTLGVPQWRPNYIFCSSHNDSAELVDQFLEHYFTLYDSNDRNQLLGLYHEKSYFSISCKFLSGQSTSHSARLSPYIVEGRNLLLANDKRKAKVLQCRGAEQIVAKLEKLPRSHHDPCSFTVDLLHHSVSSVILTVTGVFRDLYKVSPRHFMRTFILIRLQHDEYQIVNDVMYVTNVTTKEAEDAFMYVRPHRKLPKRMMKSEKNSVLEKYSQLTEMTPEWSRKCLDTVGWDLKEALQIFIEMYKANKIPVEGFINKKEKAKS